MMILWRKRYLILYKQIMINMEKKFGLITSTTQTETTLKFGVPKGIRTPVPTVKGWCPRPLDDGDFHDHFDIVN